MRSMEELNKLYLWEMTPEEKEMCIKSIDKQIAMGITPMEPRTIFQDKFPHKLCYTCEICADCPYDTGELKDNSDEEYEMIHEFFELQVSMGMNEDEADSKFRKIFPEEFESFIK